MKRLKQAKYLKLLTIQSSFKENDEKKLKLEFLERQIKLILSKNHLSTISVIDNVAQGRTIKGLGLAFNKFGVKLIGNQIVISKQSMDFFNKYKTEFGTYESFMEHQTIQENKITPHSLSHKFFPGTSVPLSHAKRVAQEQILKKEINQSAKIGYIKELFTTFGRTYYRLSVLKDNS
jgi:hypothetical protein